MEDKTYVLILTVGGSPEPLIKTIKEAAADIVYFLHSEDSKKDAEYVESEMNNDIIYKYKLIKDYQSVKETFDAAFELFSEFLDDKYFIHVDFTGGTKSMSSGLVLASTHFNKINKYTYVGTSDIEGRDKNGKGIVKDGSELITNQFNPYETYAIKEFDKGMYLFNNYQFTSAYKNFEDAKNIAQDKDYKQLAEFYNKLVVCYDSWDKFETKVTYYNPKLDKEEGILLTRFIRVNILESLKKEDILTKDYEEKQEFYKQIENNLKFLNLKISKANRHIKDNIKFYLPDLLNNAYRRIEEGKYDDAVARLYRAIELIAQINLEDKGLIDEKMLKKLVFHINKNAFNEEIKNKPNIPSKLGLYVNNDFTNEKTKTFSLGSSKSYDLLRCLGSDEARTYITDHKFKKMVETRNQSILAHGLNPMRKETANKLYNKVFEYAKLFYPDIEKYMALAEFPKFKLD